MDVFPIFYAGNIAYYRALLRSDLPYFERFEHFPKQTYRNRIEILGPNDLQKLSIPVEKTGERMPFHQVRISYAEHWQKNHWKSLETAYRRSPYFEFYEPKLRPFFKDKVEKLIDFNLGIHQVILDSLQLDLSTPLTDRYYDLPPEQDYRTQSFAEPVNDIEPYLQVFSDRHPFHANLSMLDGLFNLGPMAKELL